MFKVSAIGARQLVVHEPAEITVSVPSSIHVKKEVEEQKEYHVRKKLKNDNVAEETVTCYNNEYRLTKTGMCMSLIEQIERLESQIESQDYEVRCSDMLTSTRPRPNIFIKQYFHFFEH